jgi:hypothetical protein
MRFPYRQLAAGHSIVPLGGRWVRPRPIIGVTLVGPANSLYRDALLDTGADDCTFSESLVTLIGIDLTNAPAGSGQGIATGSIPIRYAEVTLRLTDGIEYREWRAWIGFTSGPLRSNLLGFAGFLRFFTATFHGDREEVELSVNSLYRGT